MQILIAMQKSTHDDDVSRIHAIKEMNKRPTLTLKITAEEFDNGYWYADEIKHFAKKIGIKNSGKLRKDELEELIKGYIKTGKVALAPRKNVIKKGPKDLNIGLKRSLVISHYTSNKQTKSFIKREAEKISPDLTVKSGVWYRINRWRDEQVTKGKKITYGDLIDQFVKLNSAEEFQKVPVVRYINFLSEFLAHEKSATRAEAIKEWKRLKTLPIKKDYKSWKRHMKKAELKSE